MIYSFLARAWRLPTGRIRFHQGNFLDIMNTEFFSVFKESNVILVNNYAYSAATNNALVLLFQELKEGTKIISLHPFVSINHPINRRTINMPESILEAEGFKYSGDEISWTCKEGQYYISTVNRSRLEEYKARLYAR